MASELKKKKVGQVTHLINLAKPSDHTHFKPEVLHIHLETVPARHDQSAPPLWPKQEVTCGELPAV